MAKRIVMLLAGVLMVGTAFAQHPGQSDQSDMQAMPGMQHGNTSMQPESFIDTVLQHTGSGTSVAPQSVPAHMLMTRKGNWSLMFHGEVFIADTQQSGPRGFDKFFATNWFMPMAQRELGPGRLTLRAMFSLEPATVSHRRYPLLFQTGETAYGNPIVDGQHPHDLFMEIAALYDLKLGENTLLSFYAAPVGDPAMGPTAYPHRISASENPVAPLGHHLQDSTHIADDVVTVGFAHKFVRIEASGFHGREPNENRWNIDAGRIDSWSTRLTVNPAPDWSLQYSFAYLTGPEQLHPDDDTRRMTASVTYNRPFTNGNWASTLLWGRNKGVSDRQIFNSYLMESTVRVGRNYIWGRLESLDRSNELILGEAPPPPGFTEQFAARVQAYTVGYDRELGHIPHLSIAPGAQLTLYSKPDSLTPIYGDHPVGAIFFLRLRPH